MRLASTLAAASAALAVPLAPAAKQRPRAMTAAKRRHSVGPWLQATLFRQEIRAACVTVRLASPGRPRSTTVPLCGSPENIDAVNEGCDGSLNTCVPAI